MGNSVQNAEPSSPTSNTNIQRFNIVLLGDLNVGKSSLGISYQTGKFNAKYRLPFGTTSYTKRLVISDITVDLCIWEPVNHKLFPYVWSKYVRLSDGVLLLYECSNAKSLKSLSKLLAIINKRYSDAVVFLVGTKSDCEDGSAKNDAEDFAKRENIEFFECSAKNGENVKKIFEHLVFRILQKKYLFSSQVSDESELKLDATYTEGKTPYQIPPRKRLVPKEKKSPFIVEKEPLIPEEREGKCPF